RHGADDLLRIRAAVHIHHRRSAPRNQRLEVARHSVLLYAGARLDFGLCGEPHCHGFSLKAAEPIPLSTDFHRNDPFFIQRRTLRLRTVLTKGAAQGLSITPAQNTPHLLYPEPIIFAPFCRLTSSLAAGGRTP